ncbi:MAG: NapC/NirT family cytochrome c [Polyangiaceae bacterium]
MSPLGVVCVLCAIPAIAILVRYLLKRPPLDFRWRMILFLGLGGFPAGAAITSTVSGMEATTERQFCGSCHTMDPYIWDVADAESQSLAARHGRNPFFGDRNCYVCHADYGMLGYPLTKLNGMKHVYMYYIGGWRGKTLEESQKEIHISKPYDNTNCRQCHSGTLADWSSVPEHLSLKKELESNVVSCASAGCHGFAHPFSKKDGHAAKGLPESAIGSDRPTAPVSSSLPVEARERLEAARRAQAVKEAEEKEKAEAARAAKEAEAKKAARERSEKPAGSAEVTP